MHLPFLTTAQGKPFGSAASFGNWFGECCRDAGLPKGTAAHGFRKAACRRLAEAGCSASEIMAISGHKSLSEVQRYCSAADQTRMAHAAQAKARKATCDLRFRKVLPSVGIVSFFSRMLRPCRCQAAMIAASSFFIASLSPSRSSNKWPYRSNVIVIEACPSTPCTRFGVQPRWAMKRLAAACRRV